MSCFPTDIINNIREYDDIYKDFFTKKIILNLNNNVYLFWTKHISITKGKLNDEVLKYNRSDYSGISYFSNNDYIIQYYKKKINVYYLMIYISGQLFID